MFWVSTKSSFDSFSSPMWKWTGTWRSTFPQLRLVRVIFRYLYAICLCLKSVGQLCYCASICRSLSVYGKYCDIMIISSRHAFAQKAFLMSLFTVFMFGREIVVETCKVFNDAGRLNLPCRRKWQKKLFSLLNFSDLSEYYSKQAL